MPKEAFLIIMTDKETEVANKIFYEILGSKEKALEHFKAAGTLIVSNTGDRVLLGGYKFRSTIDTEEKKLPWDGLVRVYSGWLWGNPAGGKEAGESAWETACRETKEELGIECPDSPEYPPLIMVVYESLNGPISLETLDIGVCYPVVINPSLYRPGGVVRKVRWFTRRSLRDMTEDFMDDFFLWGGAWAEMVLERWCRRVDEDLNQFSGMITFSRLAPSRWPSPYEDLKGRSVTTVGRTVVDDV